MRRDIVGMKGSILNGGGGFTVQTMKESLFLNSCEEQSSMRTAAEPRIFSDDILRSWIHSDYVYYSGQINDKNALICTKFIF